MDRSSSTIGKLTCLRSWLARVWFRGNHTPMHYSKRIIWDVFSLRSGFMLMTWLLQEGQMWSSWGRTIKLLNNGTKTMELPRSSLMNCSRFLRSHLKSQLQVSNFRLFPKIKNWRWQRHSSQIQDSRETGPVDCSAQAWPQTPRQRTLTNKHQSPESGRQETSFLFWSASTWPRTSSLLWNHSSFVAEFSVNLPSTSRTQASIAHKQLIFQLRVSCTLWFKQQWNHWPSRFKNFTQEFSSGILSQEVSITVLSFRQIH